MSREKRAPIEDVSLSPVYLSARSAIVRPEQITPVTLYSLRKWLPRLGTERWSLVQLLRGLCIDAPRRSNGTKRVTASWRFLAGCLQVHEETISSWLKHEAIPDDKPWRRLIANDDYAEYLSLFIPRLRYAYETQNGKTRRVGFTLEVLMEDPIAPEDEVQLAYQVNLLSLQQGELGLQLSDSPADVNPAAAYSRPAQPSPQPEVNEIASDLPTRRQSRSSPLTSDQVNPDFSDLLPGVKQSSPNSAHPLDQDSVDLPPRKSDEITRNVNRIKLLIEQLKTLKHQRRNYQQIFEPLIQLSEDILDDYHSTAMYYKVLRVLFPDHMDVFVKAIEQALIASAQNAHLNRGAYFVKTLRQLASERSIDLGFRQDGARTQAVAGSFVDQPPLPVEQGTPAQPAAVETASLEEVIWSEVLDTLSGQMTRAMFNAVMRGTRLRGVEGQTYVVQVENPTAQQWLEHRLKDTVERALGDVIGVPGEVEFRLSSQAA